MILGLLAGGCERQVTPLALKLAIAGQPDNALNFIAIEKGFFAANGLNTDFTLFPSGKRALDEGFLQGGFDVVTLTEVPFVFALENHPNLRIFGHIYGADNLNRLVTRQGIGFSSIEKLEGRVIGTQKFSAVHYFFHRIYNAFEIPRDAFTLKFYSAEALPKALATGEIDAFSMREPYVSQAERLMDGKVNIFSMPGIYHQYGVLVANHDTIKEKSEALKRYLKALMQAREYAISHSEEAIQILAKYLNIEMSQARVLWRPSNLQLGLSQGLVNTIEGELQWRNSLNRLGIDESPIDINKFKVKDYIDIDLMSEVNPYSVMIVYDRSQSK